MGDVITPKLSVLAEVTEFFLLLRVLVCRGIGVLTLSSFHGVSIGLVCFCIGHSLLFAAVACVSIAASTIVRSLLRCIGNLLWDILY